MAPVIAALIVEGVRREFRRKSNSVRGQGAGELRGEEGREGGKAARRFSLTVH